MDPLREGRSPRFVSIGTKLVVLIVALLSVVSLVLFLELVERERQGPILAKKTAASMVADFLAASLVAPLDFGDKDAVESELAHLKQNGDIVYAVVRGADDTTPAVELHAGASAAAAVGDDGTSTVTTVLADRVVARRSVTGPTGKRLGTTSVVFSLAAERAAYETARQRILVISIALTIAIGAVLIALARRVIVSPLERLVIAAHRLEQGDGARVEVRANDELGRLGHAFNAMASAIADREQRLAAANQRRQELFDHMRQAILVFGPDGIVEEGASRQAEVIFGSSSLEARSIGAILYPGAPAHDVEAQAFEEWWQTLFLSPASSFAEIAELAPTEIAVEPAEPGGGQRLVTLEFRPISQGEEVTRVMLLATDVTETRSLERTVAANRQEHARQMASMRRLVAGGAHQFAGFADVTAGRLARCREILGGEGLMRRAIDELFQHAHTIRGEALSFDLAQLEAETARIERVLVELRSTLPVSTSGPPSGAWVAVSPAQRAELSASIAAAIEAVQTATDQFVEASPIGRAVLDQVTVRRSDIARLEELAGERGDALGQVVERLAARPFGELASRLVDTVPALADNVGKRVRLDVEGREMLVPAALFRVLGGVLAHLVRNAVAHGIERPGERQERGKPALGRILAKCVEGARGPVITVEDDGGGLDLARLRAKAEELGVPVPEGGVAELAFVDGLSTAEEVSPLSGHGVGLAAVGTELAHIGWKVSLWSEPSRGTRFTLKHSAEAEGPARTAGEIHV